MAPRVVDLGSLKVGDEFITHMTERKGTLVHLSPSSATVVWEGSTTVHGETKWGEEFEIVRGGRRETISLKTQVLRVRRPVKKRGKTP